MPHYERHSVDTTPIYSRRQRSQEWRDAMLAGAESRVGLAERAVEEATSAGNKDDLYLCLVVLFEQYAAQGDRSRALAAMSKMEGLGIEPANTALSNALTLLTKLHDHELARAYAYRAYAISGSHHGRQVGALSILLYTFAVLEPANRQVTLILCRLTLLLQNRRYYNPHLLSALERLSVHGALPWWSGEIVLAIWSELAVRGILGNSPNAEPLQRAAALQEKVEPQPAGRAAIDVMLSVVRRGQRRSSIRPAEAG